MHYVSTRNPDTRLSAAQAIVQGLSRDGGLFLPEEIPQISLEDIKALSLLPYPARAAKLMKLYLDEFTEEELEYEHVDRTPWIIDHEIPIFTGEDRAYVDALIYVEEE